MMTKHISVAVILSVIKADYMQEHGLINSAINASNTLEYGTMGIKPCPYWEDPY